MTRFALAILFLCLAWAPAPASAQQSFNAQQQAEIRAMVRAYLVNNPDVLREALNALQARVDAERRHKAETDSRDFSIGARDAPVTIVEFFDYRCPYCKQVEPALEALLKEDRQLRIIYKELPILGKDSVYATRVALAARKQGKYDKFHAAMMAAKGQIDERVILQVAANVGLDVERVKSDMQAAEIEDVIKRNYDLAQALDVHGTPAFIIGDEMVSGAIDIATMKQKIAAARKSG